MERIVTVPRKDWEKRVEDIGFGFHTTDTPYWDESVYYTLSNYDVYLLEKATEELWGMCLEAVDYVIKNKLYDKFSIPLKFHNKIEQSWEEDHPSIYGRFDFAHKNNEIKLLEFNADTPTSLYEASVVQWNWLNDIDKNFDQFNSIHEKLIEYFKFLSTYLKDGELMFSCLMDNIEDLTTVEYMRDCAIQGGLKTDIIDISDIGWDEKTNKFVDLSGREIKNIFKLYPYEWLINEEFGNNLLINNSTTWIEPFWKMILSNKAILAVLWKLYPYNKYLLPTYFDKDYLTNYVKKPILSREGANVSIYKNDILIAETSGDYGEDGHIYQELFELPKYGDSYALIGSWVISQMPAGIGVRESKDLITNNTSRFVPHLIK
jgi:glutathionylspermidine synthase